MIFDAQLMLSPGQSLVGANGTVMSVNAIDLLAAGHDLSRGGGLRAYIEVLSDLAGGTSIQAQYVESDEPAFFSPNVLLYGPAIVANGTKAGTCILDQQIPSSRKRFIAFRYVVIGTITAGTVRGGLVADTPYTPALPAATGR